MLTILSCITGDHDIGLVGIAALVCVLSSIVLFAVLRRATECVEKRKRHWFAVAAAAAGIGVWATHFIAMLAYRGPFQLSFDIAMTLMSAAIAVAFFWMAIFCVFSMRSKSAGVVAVVGGLIAAAGVTAMHFTGMAAIERTAFIGYDRLPIAMAFLLCALCFGTAFLAFQRLQGRLRLVIPPVLTVSAVVLLHFTAMSATTILPRAYAADSSAGFSRDWLVSAVIIATLALTAIAFASSLIDRLLTDLRGLADATLEGLAIVSGDRIVEVNNRLCELLDVSPGAIVGSAPTDWFVAIDDIGEQWSKNTVEAHIRGSTDPDQIVEIALHTIEYRGRQCQVCAVRDLTDRKKAQRVVEHMAAHDALTGLANRSGLGHALDTALRKSSGNRFALLALDLDRFKAINDVFGHAAGDDILCRVANILRQATGESDFVARVGGDEFFVIQTQVAHLDDTRRLTSRIMDAFASEMDIARDPVAVGVSIGVAVYPDDGSTTEELRHNADVALYRAKRAGRGIACFFDQRMDQDVRTRRALEHDLRHALTRDQLHLVYQPLVATADGRVLGHEALLRWDHPERGMVAAETFIPVAEETGAIIAIGDWVLKQACQEAAGWPEDLSVAVNVSPVQFEVPNFTTSVKLALRESGLHPSRLEIEITEGALLRNREGALGILHMLRDMGVRIVMDDFGTGYSSLSNLQSFPFDKIKIDRSFVSSVTDDDAARSIIRAIVGLGKSLNLPVVAEGVETESQRLMVAEAGCPLAQGYYFGRPLRPSPAVLPDAVKRRA